MAESILLLPNEPSTGQKPGLTPLSGEETASWLALPGSAESEAWTEDRLSAWRGLAAFVLLADTFPDCALTVDTLTPETSALTAAVLRTLGQPSLRVAKLRRGAQEGILGLVDPKRIIRPSAQAAELRALIPADARWFSAGAGFDDPVRWLSERERALLSDRLRHFRSPEARQLAADIRAQTASQASIPDAERLPDWHTQLQAVALLADEADMTPFTRADKPLPLGGNALLAALGLVSVAPSLPPDTTWLWRGVPFARSSTALGVEPLPGADEETGEALEELRAELRTLRLGSPRFASLAAGRLEAWAAAREASLAPGALALVREDIAELRRIPVAAAAQPVFRWPLDSASPALRIILGEQLGGQWATLALTAFTDSCGKCCDIFVR